MDESSHGTNVRQRNAHRAGLVLTLLVVIPVLNHRNTNELNEDARWVAHTQEVLSLSADVLLTLVDAETGQRGYIITGKDDFLQPSTPPSGGWKNTLRS